MATHWVFSCDSGTRSSAVDGFGPAGHGTCNPQNAGAWVEVTSYEPTPFDPATLSGEALIEAFGVGFVVMGVPLIVAWSVAVIVKTIRDS